MSDHTQHEAAQQGDLFEFAHARHLLDHLLVEARLYRSGEDYKQLLQFVARMRNFAPFNAMLLQIQKPGMRFAASVRDWRERFGRHPKEGARPLLILWPFGPVGLVYDVQDTVGSELPEDVSCFVAKGAIVASAMGPIERRLARKEIQCIWVDTGDAQAGLIRRLPRRGERDSIKYQLHINRNHLPPVQFATIAHELAHLTLGHLGANKDLSIPGRTALSLPQKEIEAESVAYIVCERNGVAVKSQTYLANFVQSDATDLTLDVYRIMLATGHVEALLGLSERTRFDKAPNTKRDQPIE